MKKIAFVLAGLILAAAAFGQDNSQPEESSLAVDLGFGISFGLFDKIGSEYQSLSAALTLASVRTGLDTSVLYKVNSVVAVGGQVGLSFFQYDNNYGKSYLFIDVPVRAVARIGDPHLSIAPFLGYYFTTGFPFPGLEFGARAVLGNLYLEGSYVNGAFPWNHVAIGYAFGDLFTF